MNMSKAVSDHYDEKYFNWQASIGEFGGWANQKKFQEFIPEAGCVLDFGCGGGYMLKYLKCRRRMGVEINPAAMVQAQANGIEVYGSTNEVPTGSVDVVISNNALEHTLRPLDELKELYRVLRPGGMIVFVVPCESVGYAYRPGDINHHLYSWSPMCLGNLFSEAGFSVVEVRPYFHKWPPRHRFLARVGGALLFHTACRVYARINRRWSQVRIVAKK